MSAWLPVRLISARPPGTVGGVKTERAIFAGGCFWCTEAVFRRLLGVTDVIPGYTGGTLPDPTAEDVYTGITGHAESVRIEFDPQQISYRTLLDVFFHIHDPTTRDRQGADTGPEYRSAVFYLTENQKREAEEVISDLETSGTYKKIVTEITPAGEFYPAADRDRQYYEKNSYAPYCQVVIDPKITKLMTEYRDKLKDEYRR